MSRSVGAALPAALEARLSGRDLGRYGALAVPVASVDPDGWPHVALLSYSEVVARDRVSLRVAVGADSVSAANLRRTGALTIVIVDAGLVHYVKGTAREWRSALRAAPGSAAFEVAVADVLVDAVDPGREGQSFVRSGITVDVDPASVPRREALLAELLTDGEP